MPKIYLGLAQWHHSKWYLNSRLSSQPLTQYCQTFSSVEGNTSFYGLPSEKNLLTWQELTPDDFKFCFKFPKEISHKQGLTHCSRQVCEFLNRISLINAKLGVIWLQLEQSFGAHSLPALEKFLAQLPSEFDYAVEVRSLDWFRKDAVEQRFNRLLAKRGINRVMFDTRSLFANTQLQDDATKEALLAKPRVPAHIVATGSSPMARIIVPMQIQLGEYVLLQWVNKVVQWLEQGLTPFLFFHTPDNFQAPQLAMRFSQLLHSAYPSVEEIEPWGQDELQSRLF